MSIKQLSTAVVAITFATCTFASQANNGTGQNRMPNQPGDAYWQAPNWPGPSGMQPAYNNTKQQPAPPPVYRPQQPTYQPPAPGTNRVAPPPSAPANVQYGRPPMPYQEPYRPNYGPDRGASAYNMPGYNMPGNNSYRYNNRRRSNKFWGRSGPSTWMNPSKRGWEDGWDDMMNTPSRMGEMPGGWTAPEVTMPNPVDMGDQMQDNAQDLPDQMKNMDVGNN